MISIVASVCLIAAPAECKSLVLPVDVEEKSLTPQQCMHVGLAELAKWNEEHPDYRVERFKCEGDRKREDA